ncbi:MAG: hypothetical protein EPN84_09915, partial [Legionella sp.]
MKSILVTMIAIFSLGMSGLVTAQSIPNPADKPELGKPADQCYKKGKLKKNRVIWNGRCYVKPDCGDGY